MEKVKRKSISKKTRLEVYEKCNHRCAYCGCELDFKDMVVDHVSPVWVNEWRQKCNKDHLSIDILNDTDNYLPACRQCNLYKSTFNIDTFRERLTTTMMDNLKKEFNYKLALKYGLIEEHIKPVKFYFEILSEEAFKTTHEKKKEG